MMKSKRLNLEDLEFADDVFLIEGNRKKKQIAHTLG